MTRSYCARQTPNDWAAYVDALTGELLHVALYHNIERGSGRRRGDPPGGWDKLPTDEEF